MKLKSLNELIERQVSKEGTSKRECLNEGLRLDSND